MSILSGKYNSNLCVEIVSFEEFLQRLMRLEMPNNDVSVSINQRSKHSLLFGGIGDNEEPSPVVYYTKKAIKIDSTSDEDMRCSLFKDATIIKVPKPTSPEELVHSITVKYYEEYGVGDMIVDLGDNMYLPADKGDYTIYFNNKHSVLVTLYVGRCIVFQVSKYDNSIYKVSK